MPTKQKRIFSRIVSDAELEARMVQFFIDKGWDKEEDVVNTKKTPENGLYHRAKAGGS